MSRIFQLPSVALLVLLCPAFSRAADPVVTNVRVEPRGDDPKLADIYYDVSHADTDTLPAVWVEVTGDGGGTWTKLEHVTGDVGESVLPGVGKHIVWDMFAEFGVGSGKSYVARVVAQDAPEGMVWIPGGAFQMGDAFNEGDNDEKPVHTVTVNGFWMGKYEVTNAQYRKFNPGHSSGSYEGHDLNGRQPVVAVSWWDAIKYCNWRSGQEGLERCYNESTGSCDFSKKGYRLPTEAEWECAARGGLEGKRYVWGDGSPPPGVANVADETAKAQWSGWAIFEDYEDGYAVAAPVGSFSPNAYGLYDMAGNVWEWCNDWYAEDYYSRGVSSNPTGPASGSYRVFRGGSWLNNPDLLRCAGRLRDTPDIAWSGLGFRVARTP
jgi:formylglycine-generating enzyme required for sulfatase activity